jgi:hypothetical protein
MTRNLKVKTIAFDLSVVIDAENGARSAAGEAPLLKEGGKAVSPVSSSSGATVPPMTAQAAMKNNNHSNTKTDTKDPFAGLAGVPIDPKLKYADKLKMKLAKNVSGKVNQFGPTGLEAALHGSASRWLLAEGMGDVLDYIFNRSVRLAAIGAAVEYQPHTVQQLTTQLKSTKFAYIRPSINPNPYLNSKVPVEDIQKHIVQTFEEMEDKLQVKKTEVLVVSPEELVLAVAHQRGYYTCRFRQAGRMSGQVSTDFTANNAVEVKDAVDDLIGVALRSSAYSGF